MLLKLTEIVRYNFHLRKASIGITGEDTAFLNKGIISIKFLSENRFSSFYSDLFTPECFLKILHDLLVVADMPNEKYFLPCLLKELDEKKVCKHSCCSKWLSPLLVYLADAWVLT